MGDVKDRAAEEGLRAVKLLLRGKLGSQYKDTQDLENGQPP